VNPPTAPAGFLRARPWSAVDLVSLDFEATGLDLTRDTIISFGAVPIRSKMIDVGECRYQLVDPGDVELSPASITVHGLRPVDLDGAPSVDAAREALSDAIGGRFIVVWYAAVETAFLAKLLGGSSRSWRKRIVDTRDMLALVEPGTSYTLSEAADRYGVPVASPHHALDDALVTAQLFLVLASRLEASGRRTIREFQPALSRFLLRRAG
jgi:DNA polymerase III subunit epsilon